MDIEIVQVNQEEEVKCYESDFSIEYSTISCQNKLEIERQSEELDSSLEASCSVEFCVDGLSYGLNHAYDSGVEKYIYTCNNDVCWLPCS